MRRVVIATAVLAVLALAPAASASNPLTAYTLVVPGATSPSGLQARAVLPAGANCPALDVTVDAAGVRSDQRLPMTARRAAPSTGAAFASIFVCQAAIPAHAVRASVGATTIPAALPATISRIALLGDTGCRLKTGDPTQVCSSSAKWPLGRVAASIARAHPDVIMHIGDYFYREAACPSDMLPRCGGSPAPVPGASYRDTAYGWIADALLPLSPIFSIAPIVVTRGNHEACHRGGNGWYLFFDPWPGSEHHCAPDAQGDVPDAVSRTWTHDFPIGDGRTLHIAVVDSAYGDDGKVTAWKDHEEPLYAAAAGLSARQPGRESWLITHKPIFGVRLWYPDGGEAPYWDWTAVDQTAAALPHLGPFSLILGSHIHTAQASQIPGMPGQLVIGNSGTLLEQFGAPFQVPAVGPLRTQDGASMVPGTPLPGNATSFWNDTRFGWVLATPGAAAGTWRFSERSPNGVEFASCRLAGRALGCG